jgi:hypothetical protein
MCYAIGGCNVSVKIIFEVALNCRNKLVYFSLKSINVDESLASKKMLCTFLFTAIFELGNGSS